MADEYYDIKQDSIKVDDIANQELVGKINNKSIKLMYFTHTENVLWAADRLIKSLCFPPFEIQLRVNRYAFNLYPGQCFKWSSAKYGITDMVMRIQTAEEASLESEEIIFTCVRDPNYVASAVSILDASEFKGSATVDASLLDVDPFDYFEIFESPYALVGDNVRVTPLAARVTGKEARYMLYISLDGGTSYTSLQLIENFNPHGTLISPYNVSDRTKLDDRIGFTFDASYDADWDSVETITRNSLYAGYNLAVLGNEIICFQTITPDPITEGRYHILGVWGGRFDTEMEDHPVGTNFWFIGTSAVSVSDANLLVGASVYFKGVPITSVALGDISEATADSTTIYGRGKAPYPPSNLKANGELSSLGPIYSQGDDVVLTWGARIRGQGAGSQLADGADSPGSYEGYFRVDILMDDVVVRSTVGITAETWTYTTAMNVADGGYKDLAIKLYNYIEEAGVTYTSPAVETSVTLVEAYGESISSSSSSYSSSSSSSSSRSSSSSSMSSSSSSSSLSSSSSSNSSSSSSSSNSSSSSSSLSSSSSSSSAQP